MANPILIADIRTKLEQSRAALAAIFRDGRKQQSRYIRKTTLADTDALSARTHAWTQKDDAACDTMVLIVTDTVATRVITATLHVDGDDVVANLARRLLNKEISVSVTTIVGTTRTYLDLRDTSGDRPRLKKGVRYRLTLENTTAATTTGVCMAVLNLISVRRDR